MENRSDGVNNGLDYRLGLKDSLGFNQLQGLLTLLVGIVGNVRSQRKCNHSNGIKWRAFWSLNEDILKITILKTNTPYPSRRYGVSMPAPTKRPENIKDQYNRIQGLSKGLNTPYSRYGINIIFWKISSVKHFKSLILDELRSPDFNLLSDKEYSKEEEEAMAETMEQYMSKTQTDYRSGVKHFKSLSLDELRSPDFNLLSDKEYSKEEEEKAMAETMEQYMSKTRTDYRSGVVRPKIDNKDQFELKGQFLKELRENTFSGSDNEDANEHIEKVLEIVDLFHVPNITFLNKYCPPGRTAKKIEEINNFQQEPDETLYQELERFKEHLMKCPQHYLTEMQEVILFYNGLDVSTRQILDSRGAVLTKTIADAKTAIQEMVEYSQKWHNGTSRGRSIETSDGLAAIQAQLNNLGREIKKVNKKVYAAQVGCEQCKGPYYTKDCPQKEEGNAIEEAYYTQFGRPFQGGGYRATAPGYYQRNNANPSFQE
ncbi:reverse transcriptase domain-containing protein [Tanacetum coccineum]